MNYKNKMVLERFERNLIELSKSDTWEEASKEWGFLYKRERDNKDNHCLCSYLIKNQNYYYNKNTQYKYYNKNNEEIINDLINNKIEIKDYEVFKNYYINLIISKKKYINKNDFEYLIKTVKNINSNNDLVDYLKYNVNYQNQKQNQNQ